MIELCCGTTRLGEPCNIKVANDVWCFTHKPPVPTLEGVLADIKRRAND